MPVIARDAVASDHLVYAWPFPLGPEEHDVSCAEDELVVMCPAWLVGDRLGPGRHRWRTPDPTRPVGAFFVLTAPVEVSFDMITQFHIPATHQAVRIRAQGSLQVRCMDPALLIAQFVGLPFDAVNEGVTRSVSRSIERMLARLLTRRVVMAGTPAAVTDPQMLQNIIEELVAYNPTAGAVFGVELVRFGHLTIVADDGSRPWQQMQMNGTNVSSADIARRATPMPPPQAAPIPQAPPPNQRAMSGTLPPPPVTPAKRPDTGPTVASGEINSKPTRAPTPAPTEVSGEIGPKKPAAPNGPLSEVSGEIGGNKTPSPEKKRTSLGHAVVPSDSGPLPKAPTTTPTGSQPGSKPTPPAIPSIPKLPSMPPPPAGAVAPAAGAALTAGLATAAPAGATSAKPAPAPRRGGSIEVERTDEPTQPGIDILRTPLPGSAGAVIASAVTSQSPVVPSVSAVGTPPPPDKPDESRGSIMGVGVSHVGSTGVASGEITKKIAPGGRVLVPGPNGLMQSATVRQLLQGYYELEVGGSGETIWVPVSGVVPE
jgi:hypothetical protein